eukprot:GHVL01042261.1.p1 GENE.GHVL01042261.1~~GHVL01042261.1.p1  ORF type:complete len:361 (+),score=96.36 GHVL01042261.1:73-1155(+)
MRPYNFSAGPSMLPDCVLEQAQREMLNWGGTGVGVMEMSHRSKDFLEIYKDTCSRFRELLEISDEYEIILTQGGATLQFSSIPLNLLSNSSESTDYVITGTWSEKAYLEGCRYSNANIAINANNYTYIPNISEWNINNNSKYIHYCSNETVNGLEFKYIPETNIPLVCDMSSNICSKKIDINKYEMIYAGCQKNLGISGLTIVIINKNILNNNIQNICPTYMNLYIQNKYDSMYNTPPCYCIYITNLILKYIKSIGGLNKMEELSILKSNIIYNIIDNSDGFYTSRVNDSLYRSNMNIPFFIKNINLNDKFLSEAKANNLLNLAGHRSIGGFRASLYNGMPIEGAQKLADFMKTFKTENE